eukprot:1008285_1
MEISDDPILAQRQRRLQFQMRVARRRDVLRRVKLNESPKDEKTDDLPQEELLHCPICFDFKPESSFFRAKCEHAFCRACMREHFRVQITDANVIGLRCVQAGCDRMFKEDEILSYFADDIEIVRKYEKFKRNLQLAQNKNCRWCPKPGCETFMFGSSRKPRLACPKCSTVICFKCNNLWHEGRECQEVIDEKYGDWAKGKDIQLCPRCKARIEKEAGCNHMTCSACHYQFCWLCRGKYRSENHFAYWNFFGCPGRQFSYEFISEGRRPRALSRFAWRLLVFWGVLVCGGLALGLGAAALVLAVGVVAVCSPCIIASKVAKYYHDRSHPPSPPSDSSESVPSLAENFGHRDIEEVLEVTRSMGFLDQRAIHAVRVTHSTELWEVLEWLLAHQDDVIPPSSPDRRDFGFEDFESDSVRLVRGDSIIQNAEMQADIRDHTAQVISLGELSELAHRNSVSRNESTGIDEMYRDKLESRISFSQDGLSSRNNSSQNVLSSVNSTSRNIPPNANSISRDLLTRNSNVSKHNLTCQTNLSSNESRLTRSASQDDLIRRYYRRPSNVPSLSNKSGDYRMIRKNQNFRNDEIFQGQETRSLSSGLPSRRVNLNEADAEMNTRLVLAGFDPALSGGRLDGKALTFSSIGGISADEKK